MQHEGVETGDLQDGTERERYSSEDTLVVLVRRKGGGGGWGGERVEMLVGVEELGSCSEGRVCVPSSVWAYSSAAMLTTFLRFHQVLHT